MVSVPDMNMSNTVTYMLSRLKAVPGFPFSWIFFGGDGTVQERGGSYTPASAPASRGKCPQNPRVAMKSQVPVSPQPHVVSPPPRDGTPHSGVMSVPPQDDAQGSPHTTCSILQRKASTKSRGAAKSRVASCSATFLAKNFSMMELFWK